MGPKGFKQVELWKWAFGAGSAGKQRHGGWVPKVDSFLLSCFVLFLSCLFQVIHPFKNRESKPIDLLLFRAWLEKAMAPHSSTLAWKIPWMEEPGRLQSMGSWRSFLYSSSVYSCHLFLISSASVRSIPSLFFIEPIFSWHVPLESLIFLKRCRVFPILLFSSVSLHYSTPCCCFC